MNKTEIGNLAEKFVVIYFEKQGFLILGQKIKNKYGEIDILCYKNNIYYIVEVKFRTDKANLLYSICDKKKQRCLNAFYEFCFKKNIKYNDYKIIGAFVNLKNEIQLFYIE